MTMTHQLDLPPFEKANMIVVGDVMLDSYWSGSTDRVSPEAPVPIVKMQQYDTRPGGAANVALNLATLGCQVNLLGVVGKDAEAEDLYVQLNNKGVHCHFEVMEMGRTISKLRVLSRNQQMLRLDFESALSHYDQQRLINEYEKLLPTANLVILSDYGKGTLSSVQSFIQLAKKHHVKVFVDPKGDDFSIYRGATVMTPNLAEFEVVVGSCHKNENNLVNKANTLIAEQELQALLVTRGKDGMTLVFANQHKPMHLKAHARDVFDVTGAGDTVIAVMGAAVALGENDTRAAYLANVAAGLVVRKVGTAFVTVAELRNEIRREMGMAQGILSQAELLSMVADAKKKGEKIVMTNGCFDILHPGHIQYLNQARALGDRLIVAVNSDDSVARLKGPARPINALEVRMEILAALRAVDWVVPFSEDTPEKLISEVLPDILLKGGDYTAEQVAGHKAVRNAGGEVVILPFREGYSTTKLVEKFSDSR